MTAALDDRIIELRKKINEIENNMQCMEEELEIKHEDLNALKK